MTSAAPKDTPRQLDARNIWLANVMSGGVRLEHPNASSVHVVIDHALEVSSGNPEIAMYLLRSQVFVVEHDWGAAFSSAEGFDGGEHRLPFDDCVFEFKINGTRFTAYYQNRPGEDPPIAAMLFANIGEQAWYPGRKWVTLPHLFYHVSGRWWAKEPDELRIYDDPTFELLAFIDAQVRAITVGLEAEVLLGDPRAPVFSVWRERKGMVQQRPYSVVTLRPRATRTPFAATQDGERSSPRLHFRRGHFWPADPNDPRRHWRKWTLVGDPDLGFIDKRYRTGVPR